MSIMIDIRDNKDKELNIKRILNWGTWIRRWPWYWEFYEMSVKVWMKRNRQNWAKREWVIKTA